MRIRNELEANSAIEKACKERIARQGWADPSKRVHAPIPVGWMLLWGLAVFWGCVAWVVS